MEAHEYKGWSNADILSFIRAYEACPQLWNQTDPNYNNKPVRIQVWGRIAMKFGVTKVECKKKIFGLISTYRQLRATEKNANANGEATEPSWFAYRALKFLDDRDTKTAPPQVDCPASEREVIIDILTLYKESRCLWDTAHPLYVHKEVRHEALCTMLVELRKIQPMSNVDTVKRKIENLKTAYRRQRSKIEKSRKNGKVDQPTLWYYKYLTFLDDKNVKSDKNALISVDEDTNVDSKDMFPVDEDTDVDSKDMFPNDADLLEAHESGLSNEEIEQEAIYDNQLPEPQQKVGVVHRTRKRRLKTQHDDTNLIASTLEILESTAKRLHNETEQNEIATFCKFISSKMSSYSKSSRQGVQHAFYDILVKADRGHFE